MTMGQLTRWLDKNKALALGGLGLGLAWYYFRGRRGAERVGGFYADAAKKLGIQTDLTTLEAQAYLNVITGKKSPARGGTGLVEDGILGTKTSDALRKFQASNGIPQTGYVDTETGAALSYLAGAVGKSPAMRKAVTLSPLQIAQMDKSGKKKPVTYTPSPMPVVYTPYPMPGTKVTLPAQPIQWADDPNIQWADDPNIQWADDPNMPPGDFRTGIQSTSMYDPRYYDYPSFVLSDEDLRAEEDLIMQGALEDFVPPWQLGWMY